MSGQCLAEPTHDGLEFKGGHTYLLTFASRCVERSVRCPWLVAERMEISNVSPEYPKSLQSPFSTGKDGSEDYTVNSVMESEG